MSHDDEELRDLERALMVCGVLLLTPVFLGPVAVVLAFAGHDKIAELLMGTAAISFLIGYFKGQAISAKLDP